MGQVLDHLNEQRRPTVTQPVLDLGAAMAGTLTMAWGAMDTTPPAWSSASICSSMIRPLAPAGFDEPTGPIPAPVMSTVMPPEGGPPRLAGRFQPGGLNRDPRDAADQVVEVWVAAHRDSADQHHE